MAERVPKIVDMALRPPDDPSATLRLDTPAWFAWLDRARSFAFHHEGGALTARKERRRGHWYWYAYARDAGRLRCVYLGRSPDVTSERLLTVLEKLLRSDEVRRDGLLAQHYGHRSPAARAAARSAAPAETAPSEQRERPNVALARERVERVLRQVQALGALGLRDAHVLIELADQCIDTLRDDEQRHAAELEILRRLLREALHGAGPHSMPESRGHERSGEIF